VRSFVRKTVRNDFDVDDVIQQTLLKAYTRLHQFRFQASFRIWLISIARNEIRENVRLRSNSQLVFDEGNSASVMTSDSRDGPFEIYARKEISHQVWHAIANLPAKYRLIIELLVGEKSLAETASELSISGSAARSRRFRARRELCRLLAKSGETRSSRSGLSSNASRKQVPRRPLCEDLSRGPKNGAGLHFGIDNRHPPVCEPNTSFVWRFVVLLAVIGTASYATKTRTAQLRNGTRSTPKRIVTAQHADQITDFMRHSRTPALAAPDSPSPKETEPLAMPADDGRWFDDHQGGFHSAQTPRSHTQKIRSAGVSFSCFGAERRSTSS
jgi:RNA polymerase sigma-70 factor, ECF subfamily